MDLTKKIIKKGEFVMSKKSVHSKLLTLLLAAVLLSTTFLYSCSNNSTAQINTDTQTVVTEQSDSNVIVDEDISTVISDLVTYDNDDYYSGWENENPNYIELNETDASLKGSGAEVKDSTVTITTAGVYVLSGKLDDGQIVVDVEDKGIVRPILNGVEINCTDNAPIYVKNAEKLL